MNSKRSPQSVADRRWWQEMGGEEFSCGVWKMSSATGSWESGSDNMTMEFKSGGESAEEVKFLTNFYKIL